MKNAILLVAGGTGTRMESHVPKQFLELNGKPILQRTLEVVYAFDPSLHIVVVMHHHFIGYWNDLCRTLAIEVPHAVVAGGAERFHSVKNGLASLPEDIAVVAVHDAVRPLVNNQTLRNCFNGALEHGSAVPTLPLSDSIREVRLGQSKHVDRSLYHLVQTPQCFSRTLLQQAYEQDYIPLFTDDASVVESVGHSIHLVAGNAENIKITTPTDLLFAGLFFPKSE
jgi:2-C-methyl-D-erythritol 4-phosphate cytidylyltransferase